MSSLHFGFGSRLPLVMQAEAGECGLACLAMVAAFHGKHVELRDLRIRFPLTLKGLTLADLSEMAGQLQLVPRSLGLELDELKQLKTPAILHWDLDHFVVLRAVRGGKVYLHDPAVGAMRLSLREASAHFTGVALECTPGMEFRRQAPKQSIGLRALVGKVSGLKRALFQLLVLALGLEALSVAPPLLQQCLMDDALVRGDAKLLNVICLGMLGLGVATTAVNTARAWVGLYISTHFNLQWMANVMGRLLQLPVKYFEQRHVGDIVSRFGAIQTLEHGLTTATIDAFLDGLLAAGTFAMMCLYDGALSALSFSIVALYAGLRWLRYNTERMAATGVITKQAREQSYFLETVRGVRSIKLYNREQQRRGAWLNLRVAVVNANLTIQKLSMAFGLSWGLLASVERTAVLWIGAHAVLAHQMSLGMLFAFIGFKEQFSGRASQLVNRIVEFRMLGISADRLADIVLTAPEEKHDRRMHDLPQDLSLTLERVHFRYGKGEPLLLKNASLTIAPGECIAIVGPSGSGKTSCMKLMLGMLEPNQGVVRLGGLSLQQIGLSAYRGLSATVLQDDQLFSGSIYDNICFLDERPDEAWLYECARMAQIHDDILAMPMGYQTLVGDMGTALSGGQKQRVMLARALYKRPRLLFLDEASSHLDLDNERQIAAGLKALQMTRIMIAHRPETIAIADRVFHLRDGQLEEIDRAIKSEAPALSLAT